MFGHDYYHHTLKRYVAVFGTLFNDLKIDRKDNNGTVIQSLTVPLTYAPVQKVLARVRQDPSFDRKEAAILPRMGFEIIGMVYDGERKMNKMKNTKRATSNTAFVDHILAPAPYNIDIELTILSKYMEDGSKIIEQILPYFTPDWTPSVKMVDGIDMTLDIPIILNSVVSDISYEGDVGERSIMSWTLGFTIKGYFFGPTTQKKIIKFANTNLYTSLTANTAEERVTVQPGVDANGIPTTSANNSIPWTDIDFDDDWDYIVTIEDLT